jgi:3-oxoacyl-[acyl-carrier-protein] synthase-1
MKKVFVTGLGFISSIGNSQLQVLNSLKDLKHGFEPLPGSFGECRPLHLYGSIKDFDTCNPDPEDWTYPERYRFSRVQLRSMSPHVLYATAAVQDALADANLVNDAISNLRTGIYTASAGSPFILHQQLNKMDAHGVMRCSPYGVVASTVGTLTFNLASSLKILGASCGMASACASSAHALGFAYDAIALGRQDRMLVVGAEDGNRESILPFASMRALSLADVPEQASCPFDVARSGFVGTGGACALILESEETVLKRQAKPYVELLGWGQASDGHSPAMSHPEGLGLAQAMQNALDSCRVDPAMIDYVNAHATSTLVGDFSEIQAIQSVFGQGAEGPQISSTKALTGHALSMAGALEAGICSLATAEGIIPGSAHIRELDPAASGLNICRSTVTKHPKLVMSNSSGFGGSNVSLVFQACDV